MILLPLGLLLMMMWSLRWTAFATSDAIAPLLRFAPRGRTTAALVTREALGALASCAPHAQMIRASIAQALRLDSWRVNLMRACFADLGIWLVLFVSGFFLQFNGLFVLAATGWLFLVLAFGFKPAWLRSLSAALFTLGLFLIFAEAFMRFSHGWMQGETTDFSMLLADNRPTAVLILTAAMTVVSAVTGLEFLAPALALGGLASGAFSLNGAVALMWGERLGLTLRYWFQSRKQIASVRRLAKLMAISTIAALPISFLILGLGREFILFGTNVEGFLGVVRIENFISLTFATTIPFFAVASIVGHFAAPKSTDDLLERAKIPPVWLREGEVGTLQVQFAKDGLDRRRAEISRIRQNMTDAEWAKVPPFVREASQQEFDHLQDVEQTLETHLSSRWSFFGHQRR